MHGQEWDWRYKRGPWGNVESSEIVVKKMSCKCHKLVCEEHAAPLRPFEEPSVGVIRGKCELCGKEIVGGGKVAYAWLPTELFDKLQKVNEK